MNTLEHPGPRGTGASAGAAVTRGAPVVIRIAPSKGWVALRLGEVWEYRELLFFLTRRDIAVRYKQTVLGVAWAVLQPVLTMLVFTLFFGKLGGMKSDGLPYAPFTLAALVPWTFFAYGLAQSANSLVGSQNLLKKVYFPRLIIPLASVLSGTVDFLIAFGLLLVMLPCYHLWPTAHVVWLPCFAALALISSLGVGLWLSALNVEYRDVRYTVPFLTQFWLFATPVAYASSLLEGHPWAKLAYGLNPLAGVVDGFRWALLGDELARPGPMILASTVSAVVVLVTGALYFRRMEKSFADVV